MPAVEAQVPTDRAGRYLVQFCRHADQMSRMRHPTPTRHEGRRPPAVEHVDWSDTSGTIRFNHGTCTLQATSTALVIRVEAADNDTLRQLQDGITRRLETIGRRDHLCAHWHRLDSAPNGATTSTASPTGRAQRPRTLVLLTAAALAIAVHVGLLGNALTASAWAGWGTNIVLAIILVKVITIGVHAVLGRVAFRYRGTIHRCERWQSVLDRCIRW